MKSSAGPLASRELRRVESGPLPGRIEPAKGPAPHVPPYCPVVVRRPTASGAALSAAPDQSCRRGDGNLAGASVALGQPVSPPSLAPPTRPPLNPTPQSGRDPSKDDCEDPHLPSEKEVTGQPTHTYSRH